MDIGFASPGQKEHTPWWGDTNVPSNRMNHKTLTFAPSQTGMSEPRPHLRQEYLLPSE